MITVWEPFVANCPFLGKDDCSWDQCLLQHLDPIINHLSSSHNFKLLNPREIVPYAQDYLSALSSMHDAFDPQVDLDLRASLLHKKLWQMCKIQEEERLQSFNRKCLFCKEQVSDRLLYFNHLKDSHGFNTGHPDNLVKIHGFLDYCQVLLDKNQCIYCKKDFPDSILLRKHMRKKKHFKINAKDESFDRFYIINYKQRDEVIDEPIDDDAGYSDWEEEEDGITMCLFDDNLFPTSDIAMMHMKSEHAFDLINLKKEHGWDFYDCVMLINYIRRCTSYLKCYYCHYSTDSFLSLDEHYSITRHDSKVPDESLWRTSIYLFPTYEGDPLLMSPDLMEGCSDSYIDGSQ